MTRLDRRMVPRHNCALKGLPIKPGEKLLSSLLILYTHNRANHPFDCIHTCPYPICPQFPHILHLSHASRVGRH